VDSARSNGALLSPVHIPRGPARSGCFEKRMGIRVAAPQAFGSMLKRFRLEAGMSQVELAAAAGFSMVYVSMLERGKRLPPPATVDVLAGALDLPAVDRARLVGTISPPRSARTMGLPAPVTSFVGREVEVALVTEMFLDSDVRLVTLLGPGGVGKTRLATQIARQIQFDVTDGAVFVPLDSIASFEDVADLLIDAFGLARQPAVSPEELLLSSIHDRSLLLLLDNFEHVLPAGGLVGKLLAAGPKLRVLTTSRSPLGMYGERLFQVDPLPRPVARAPWTPGETVDPELLGATAASAAAQLFVDRAQAADSTFRLTNKTAFAVARICDTLDGLPLAIELTAARVRHYPVATVAEQLSHSFTGIARKVTATTERHQSLSQVFGWSYQLLDPRSQSVFRRLSVFSGGFTPEAAEAVCRVEGDAEVEPVVEGLIDASLIQRSATLGDGRRLTMLQTVRQFAGECLAGTDEANEIRRRHFSYCLALAQQTTPLLWSAGSVPVELDNEAANMQMALAWAHENCPWEGLKLASPMADFADFRGHARSALTWLRKMLKSAGPMSSRPPEMPLNEARLARAKALISSAALATHVGEMEDADVYAAEGLAMFERMDDKRRLAWALNVSSFPALYDGRHQRAWDFLERSLAVYREIDDATGIMQITVTLGAAATLLGDFTSAAALLEEGLALSRQANNLVASARAMNNLGYALVKLGNGARALALARESLALRNDIDDPRGIIESFELLAVLAGQSGDHPRCARMLGAAQSLRELHAIAATLAYSRELVAESAAAAVSALGRRRYDAYGADGARLSLTQAVQLGLEESTRLPLALQVPSRTLAEGHQG
jgi:predicted ATPase/transcriptional regulator with XRE-family HTH domain